MRLARIPRLNKTLNRTRNRRDDVQTRLRQGAQEAANKVRVVRRPPPGVARGSGNNDAKRPERISTMHSVELSRIAPAPGCASLLCAGAMMRVRLRTGRSASL